MTFVNNISYCFTLTNQQTNPTCTHTILMCIHTILTCTAARCPANAALYNGVLPNCPRLLGFAPRPNKSLIVSGWPPADASDIGVLLLASVQSMKLYNSLGSNAGTVQAASTYVGCVSTKSKSPTVKQHYTLVYILYK